MYVIKRDGTRKEFDQEKIVAAMSKAFVAETGKADPIVINYLTAKVVEKVPKRNPTVEGIQNIVVRTMQEAGYYDVRLPTQSTGTTGL